VSDQAALTTFLADLGTGRVAMAPFAAQTTPIQIILGDYLGNEGVIAKEGGTQVRGIRVEVFSPALLPGFTRVGFDTGWGPFPPATELPAQQFPSEWARDLTEAESTALQALGVDRTMVTWWPDVAARMTPDPRVAAADRLPASGMVFHYQPFDFLRWINRTTWNSEWPKYEVFVAGNAQAAPAAPRSRSVV
jgi:hypothetical protein